MLRGGLILRLRHVRTPWVVGGVRGRRSWKDADPSGFVHSEEEARERFEKWCKKYGKTYPSEEEKLMRFGVFRASLECITQLNKEYDILKLDTYSNADETEKEYLNRCGGWNYDWPKPKNGGENDVVTTTSSGKTTTSLGRCCSNSGGTTLETFSSLSEKKGPRKKRSI